MRFAARPLVAKSVAEHLVGHERREADNRTRDLLRIAEAEGTTKVARGNFLIESELTALDANLLEALVGIG